MYNTYIYIQCHFPISNDYTIKCKQGFSKTLKHSKSKPSFRPSHSKGKILTVQQPIVMSFIIHDLALCDILEQYKLQFSMLCPKLTKNSVYHYLQNINSCFAFQSATFSFQERQGGVQISMVRSQEKLSLTLSTVSQYSCINV